MSRLQKIIDQLPEAFRPLAAQYVAMTTDQITDQVLAVMDLLAEGDSSAALKRVVKGLSTAELGLMLGAVNADLTQVSRKKNDYNQAVYGLVRQSVQIGLGMLLVKADEH